MALPEVLSAGHLAGRRPAGASASGPGGPGRSAPVSAAPGISAGKRRPGRGAVSGGAPRFGNRHAVISPAPRSDGDLVAGLLCGCGDGQLVSS